MSDGEEQSDKFMKIDLPESEEQFARRSAPRILLNNCPFPGDLTVTADGCRVDTVHLLDYTRSGMAVSSRDLLEPGTLCTCRIFKRGEGRVPVSMEVIHCEKIHSQGSLLFRIGLHSRDPDIILDECFFGWIRKKTV